MRGKFITFEGCEGSGKSTQIERLEGYLKRCGVNCKVLREPGGTDVGEDIRRILLKKRPGSMDYLAETLLYTAARAQLVNDVIKPALDKGIWTLCDRYIDSTVAYQGYGRERAQGEITWIRQLSERIVSSQGLAKNPAIPDLTLLLDIDVSKGLARVKKRNSRPDRLESESLAFHERVRNGYLKIQKEDSDRVYRIDANGARDEVWKEVQKAADRLIDHAR